MLDFSHTSVFRAKWKEVKISDPDHPTWVTLKQILGVSALPASPSSANALTLPASPISLGVGSEDASSSSAVSSTVDLKWNESSGALTYTVSIKGIRIGDVQSFSQIRNTSLKTPNLRLNENYSWTVVACNAFACGPSSKPRYFSTSVVPSEAENTRPVLSQVSNTGPSVEPGVTYSVTFHATDANSNLSKIEINWNDGAANAIESREVSDGNSGWVTFTRKFSTEGFVSWTANAYDKGPADTNRSNLISGTLSVAAPGSVPKPAVGKLSSPLLAVWLLLVQVHATSQPTGLQVIPSAKLA